jgi:hypothetical protein
MADAPAAPAVTQPAAPAAPAAPAVPGISGQPSSITMKFSELKPHERKAFAADVAAALKADLDPAIASIRKDVNEEKRNRKKANLSAFVEKNQLAHRIAPHEMDAAGGMPTLLDELMGLDDEKVVHKFSEGGKVKELTQLDVAMLRIERRPPMKFTEKIKSGTAKPGDPNDDEVVKVRQYAEDPSFAKVLAASGQTPADYVHKFSEAKKKRPSLTAAEYGVPKAD